MTDADMNGIFRRFAQGVAHVSGLPWTFFAAFALILVWALSGPIFGFSDTWQLVINTTTTIVTFLMVFLIQNTQNRDAKALHLKLDELIRAVTGARTSLVHLESLSDEEISQLEEQFAKLHDRGRHPHNGNGTSAASAGASRARKKVPRRGASKAKRPPS